MTRILIVDDEPDIREMIQFALTAAGFEVAEAGHADEARTEMNSRLPDLVLMDWMLPGRSGLELAREMKQVPRTRDLPVIMLTARTEERDKVQGLDGGADDYVTKPFSPRELVARINAVLRRTRRFQDKECVLEFDGLCLDPASGRVCVNGQALCISPTEYRLLKFLMEHPDRVFNRSQLLDRAWGDNIYVEERTVDVHIRRLRKSLEPFSLDRLIQTVRGSGYRFSMMG